MPDYYDNITNTIKFEESQFYPKSMTEICSDVNMTALLAYAFVFLKKLLNYKNY